MPTFNYYLIALSILTCITIAVGVIYVIKILCKTFIQSQEINFIAHNLRAIIQRLIFLI